MKKLSLFAAVLATAVFAAACGGTSDNRSTGTNLQTTEMPTKDDLIELDRKAGEAWTGHDADAMAYFLSDNYVGFGDKGPEDKGLALKSVTDHKCDIKNFTMDETRMQVISQDVILLTYKATYDGTCDGQKVPDTRAATLFVRRFNEWKGAYHSETPIGAAASGDKKAETAKNAATKTEKPSNTANAADKQPASNTETKPADANQNSNTAPAASGPPSPGMKPDYDPLLTQALIAVEKSGWDAWKAKDAKTLEDITGKDISFIDASGREFADKAATLKAWAEPCTVSNVALSDGYSVSVTADISILLYKSTPSGTCGSTKLAPVWGGTVFERENGIWKAVFASEVPVR